jgi:hypothetical protein
VVSILKKEEGGEMKRVTVRTRRRIRRTSTSIGKKINNFGCTSVHPRTRKKKKSNEHHTRRRQLLKKEQSAQPDDAKKKKIIYLMW